MRRLDYPSRWLPRSFSSDFKRLTALTASVWISTASLYISSTPILVEAFAGLANFNDGVPPPPSPPAFLTFSINRLQTIRLAASTFVPPPRIPPRMPNPAALAPTPCAPIITPAAVPPIAALWHHAKKLPVCTSPILDCHTAAAEPAAGPIAEKPAIPRAGLMREAAPKTKKPVMVIPLLMGFAFTCASSFPRMLVWPMGGTIGFVSVSTNCGDGRMRG